MFNVHYSCGAEKSFDYPDESLELSGDLWVCLTVHAKRAFTDPDQFRARKGTKGFHDALLKLGDDWGAFRSNFEISKGANKIRENGLAAGVYNQYPLDNEFVPIFRYRANDPLLDSDLLSKMGNKKYGKKDLCRAIEEWQQWSKQLLLTRYGFFQLWLKRKLDGVGFAEALGRGHSLDRFCPSIVPSKRCRELYDFSSFKAVRAAGELSNQCFSCQWEFSRILITKFLEDINLYFGELGGLLVRDDFESRWYQDLEPNERKNNCKLDLPLRWRHVAFVVRSLERNGKLIEDIGKCEKRHLAALTEGVPVRKGATETTASPKAIANDGVLTSPSLPDIGHQALDRWIKEDLSSWDGELMLVSTDITMIYSSIAETTICGFSRHISCKDYWMTILRGIAFFCELRVLAARGKSRASISLGGSAAYGKIYPSLRGKPYGNGYQTRIGSDLD